MTTKANKIQQQTAYYDLMLPVGSNRCLCVSCGEYFGSVTPFDMHIVALTADCRCRTASEMVSRGMSQNEHGYWVTRTWDSEVFKASA